MKFSKGMIRLANNDVPLAEEAMVAGPFAVHQTRYSDMSLAEDAWTITHVPTGFCFIQDAESEEAAMQFCDDIKDLTSWDFDDPQVVTKLLDTPGYSVLINAVARARGWDVIEVSP